METLKQAPEISRVMPFYTDETLQIFGENLPQAVVYWWQPESGPMPASSAWETPTLPKTPPPDAVRLETVASFAQVLYARSKELRPGCALLWVENEAGLSAPRAVNVPTIWSQSAIRMMAGERLTLYGCNFFARQDKCFLQAVGSARRTDGLQVELTWALSQDYQQNMPHQNEYKSEYLLPDDMPAGEYEIRVHTGTGGAFGWSEPMRLTIVESMDLIEWGMNRWRMDIRHARPFSMEGVMVEMIDAALGNGLCDATDALQGAIDRVAAAGGGMVVLPAGTYGIRRTLHLRPGVVLRGSGIGATTIRVVFGGELERYWPPVKYATRKNGAMRWAADWEPLMRPYNNTPLVWIETRAGMECLKLEGGTGAVYLTLVGSTTDEPSRSVFFNEVEFDHTGEYGVYEHGDYNTPFTGVVCVGHNEDFTMFRCRLYCAATLTMLPAKNIRTHLVANHFEVTPRHATNNVFLGGTYRSVICENTFKNGKRTLMSQQGFSHNYVFENQSMNVSRCTNADEEYMSEFGFSEWTGYAQAIGPDSIAAAEDLAGRPLLHCDRGTLGGNFDEYEWMLVIVQGRGLGQYRHVKAVEGNRLILDRPWDVTPDETTFFNLVIGTEHNIWVQNNAMFGNGASLFLWMVGIENIIAGHQILLSAGISLYSRHLIRDEEGNIIQRGMLAYNRVVGCEVRLSGTGIYLWSNGHWSTQRKYEAEYENIIGNSFSGNICTGASEGCYEKNQPGWDPVNPISGIQLTGSYNLVQKNTIAGYTNGIHVRENAVGTVLVNNRFVGIPTPVLNQGWYTKII